MDYVEAKKMSKKIESNPNAWHSKTLKEKMINVLNQSFIAKDFCLNAFDEIKNNEFDWYWHEEERVLEFNWVPEQNPPLDMYLVIDEPVYGLPVYTNGYSSKAVIYLKKDS